MAGTWTAETGLRGSCSLPGVSVEWAGPVEGSVLFAGAPGDSLIGPVTPGFSGFYLLGFGPERGGHGSRSAPVVAGATSFLFVTLSAGPVRRWFI